MEVRKGFKFSQATANNLKELVGLGIARNETEAIDLSVEHYLTEKRTLSSCSSSEASKA